jgi:putative salt-induced outer membrane protein YdiY
MKSALKIHISVIVIFLSFTSIAFSDMVFFKNGDRLSGKVKQLTDSTLILESDFAGEVTINLSDVQTLSTEEPVTVNLADGTVLKQRLLSAEPGQVLIEGTEAIKQQSIELQNINAINPPPKEIPKWHGSISAGLAATRGNTDTDRYNFSANISKRSENDRITISGDYVRSKDKDQNTGDKNVTENWWRVTGKYDYFITEKKYVFANGRYEKDSIADLDRRVIVGGGGGYQWYEKEDFSFATEAGLASRYEKFENETDSQTEVSAQLGYNVSAKIRKNLRFIHDLTYYPSLEQFSDYYLTSNAELRADLIDNFFTSLKVIFNYDATPAEGSDKTDVKYIWGFGWSF